MFDDAMCLYVDIWVERFLISVQKRKKKKKFVYLRVVLSNSWLKKEKIYIYIYIFSIRNMPFFPCAFCEWHSKQPALETSV